MTAADIDLYRQVVQYEGVGGANADSAPEEWERALPGSAHRIFPGEIWSISVTPG